MMEKVPMTEAGHAAMMDEIKHLKVVERPRIIRAIEEARSHGDLSENAEYHAAKEQMSPSCQATPSNLALTLRSSKRRRMKNPPTGSLASSRPTSKRA